MAILERQALDMSAILIKSSEISDMIARSREVADYLYWKERLAEDADVQKAIARLGREKERFSECERFGHFHPDYHRALEAARKAQEDLERLPVAAAFKRAEDALDDLLYTVAKTIAGAVSDSVKVPGNHVIEEGGCCSGGSCGGRCG